MRSIIVSLLAVLASVSLAGTAIAEDLESVVRKGCGPEIENFCSQVSLGEGRLLACFYAHEDKLSGQCQYALYNAAAQLEHAVSALNYVAGQCEDDIAGLCAEVQLGEGRVIDCLKSKPEAVSAACNQALGEVFK